MCEIFCKLFTSFLMEINLLRFWILSFRNYYNKKLSNVYANFVVGSMAERSKALVLGTSLFGGVGSNPTAAILFCTHLLFMYNFISSSNLLNSKIFIAVWPNGRSV